MSTVETAQPHVVTARPARRRTAMPYLRAETMRRLRDPYSLVFMLALPSLMYLLFGAFTDYGDTSAGHGTVSFYVLISMASFGAVTTMTSLTAMVALEVQQGWQRQLMLSGLSMARFILLKVLNSLAVTALGTLLILLVGYLTGAEADDLGVWAACFVLVLVTSPVLGLYGLAVALLFRSDSAVGLASAMLTLFAFFGNLSIPLDGVMLDIARFTPLYGIATLVRWPITEGAVPDTTITEPLWTAILSIVAWAVVFGGAALLAARGSTSRT